MHALIFVCGMFVGAFIIVTIMACINAGSRADKYLEDTEEVEYEKSN